MRRARGHVARLRAGCTAARKRSCRVVLDRPAHRPVVLEQDDGPALGVDDAVRAAAALERAGSKGSPSTQRAYLYGSCLRWIDTLYSDSSRCSMTSNCSTPTAPRIGSRSSRWRSKNSWTAPSSDSCSSPFLSCFRFSGSFERHPDEVLGREARAPPRTRTTRPRPACRRCAGCRRPTRPGCRPRRPRRS